MKKSESSLIWIWNKRHRHICKKSGKLWKQSHALPLRAVTDQPLFYLAILAVILGVQLFLAGFLGELINRGSSERNKYLIDKTL